MVESKKLLIEIQKVFINQDKYIFDKYVPEFDVDGKFLGDCYNITIVEPKDTNPPRFYHTFSPFDVISNAAPDRALVFENGELLLNIDFTHLIKERTGAMDSVILLNCGVDSTRGKKVLYLGSGGTAQASLKILKTHFPELSEIDCINNSNDLARFKEFAKQLGVKVAKGSYDQIEEYDYIFCHTSTEKTLLTENALQRIKKGAIITSFISSTEHGEVADEFYDPENANIIVDWQQTLKSAKDLARAIQKGQTHETEIIFLRDLFNKTQQIDMRKKYTIYRSVGTPMQNLAVLRLLLEEN